MDGKPWIVAGSPGSERIFSTISQFIVDVTDREIPMSESIPRPRFHCSIGGKISIEAEGFDDSLIEYLENMGYKIKRKARFPIILEQSTRL